MNICLPYCAEAIISGDEIVFQTLNIPSTPAHRDVLASLLESSENQPSRLTWLLQSPDKINGNNVLQHLDRLSSIESLTLPEGIALKLANMMKNRRLACHIEDAAWSEFVAKLAYKAESTGVHLVKLDQGFASSKKCHCCAHKMPEMPLKVREWACLGCNANHGRDINAALNIQRKGITELMAAGHVVKAHRGLRKSGSMPVAA